MNLHVCILHWILGGVAIIAVPFASAVESTLIEGAPWQRHAIDNTSKGADGARLADVNADNWPDIVTPWEEGGEVRLYLNPGPERVREPWPQVTVGVVASPEDAVCADLDGDGALDVISSTEGDNRTIYIHWGPVSPDDYLTGSAWATEALPASKSKRQWMFALPVQIDGEHGVDLVAGSKNEGAQLGWFQAPEDARNLKEWQWHMLRQAAWTMSLWSEDLDDDGNWDIVYSERRGQNTGCWWLRHPGEKYLYETWQPSRIAGYQYETMFMTACDIDADGKRDFVAATSGGPVLRAVPAPSEKQRALEQVWLTQEIDMPGNAGTGKGVAVGYIDQDESQDIVVTCENSEGKHGVFWLSYRSVTEWQAHDISGIEGIKFDMVSLQDLDFDGDLDAITCEERDNLGVIWYENPFGPRLVQPGADANAPADAPVEEEAEGKVVTGEKEGQQNKSLIRRLFNKKQKGD